MSSKKKSVQNRHTESAVVSNNQGSVLAHMRASILPPPKEMEHYESLCPGITTTLIDTYKQQVEHRINIESKVVESGIKNSARGQIFAFIITSITILSGVVLIIVDKNVLGITSIIGALTALVGIFIYSTKSKKDERIQKANANPE